MSKAQVPMAEDYVTAYDAAQRRSARLAAAAVESEKQDASYAAQGRALYQIKELARAGYLLLPEASEAKFEQLWRTAFQLPYPSQDNS